MEALRTQLKLPWWSSLAAIFSWGVVGRLAKAVQLLEKASSQASTTPDAALQTYRRLQALVQDLKERQKDRDLVVGTASLSMGQLQERLKDVSGAVESYLRARSLLASIPHAAVLFIADGMASRGDTTKKAIDIYVEALRLKTKVRARDLSPAVYQILEKNAAFDENTDAVERGKRTTLCRQIITAAPALDWPHYYLGLAEFIQKNYSAAATHLKQAQTLHCQRPLLSFYFCFATGTTFLQSGQIQQAIPFFRDAATQGAQRPEGHFYLGKALLDSCGGEQGTKVREHANEAARALEQATSLQPKSGEYFYHLGRARMLLEEFAGAIEALDRATALDRQQPQWYLELAQALRKLGRKHEARSAARSAIFLDSKSVTAHRICGELCFELEEFAPAVDEFKIVVSSGTIDDKIRTQLGIALYHLSKFAEAIAYLREIVSRCEEASFFLARSLAQTDDFAGVAHELEQLEQRRAEEVRRRFRRDLEFGVAPTPTELVRQNEQDSRYEYFLGLAYCHLGRYREAIEKLETALHLGYSRGATLYLQLGHAYNKVGNNASAIGSYLNALEVDSTNIEAQFHLGILQLQHEEQAGADRLSSILKSAPDCVPAYLALGSHFARRGNFDDAISHYNSALRVDRKNGYLRRCLGVLYCRLEDYVTAYEHLMEAATLGEESDETLYYLGLAAVNKNDLPVALEAWSKLQQRHPDDRRLGLNLNKLHYLQGQEHIRGKRFKEAIAEWKLFLTPRPDDEDTKKELAKLYLKFAFQSWNGSENSAITPTIREEIKRALDEALALDPSNVLCQYYRAVYDLVDSGSDHYISTVEPLLSRLNGYHRACALYNLALCHIAKGNLDVAQTLLESLQPEQAKPVALALDLPMAVIHARCNRWAEVVATLAKSKSINGEVALGAGAPAGSSA